MEEEQKPADQSKVMAVLAYIGPLVVISYLTAKDNATVKFHIKQGLVLLVMWVVIWILFSVLFIPFLRQILNLAQLCVLVFAIIGIMNAWNGKEKELPLVGQFARYFSI